MIYLLLAAGAAADTSAKFLALEQDWATDKVGLFFQHKDFETAWSNIERDIEPLSCCATSRPRSPCLARATVSPGRSVARSVRAT